MRDAFRGWYKPTAEDVDALWDQGTIVFDANVLLAPYRLAPDARNRLFDLVEAFKARIWVPYQAGLEYQQNRLAVVTAQRGTYDDIRSAVEDAERSLLNRRRDHPVVDPSEFQAVVQRALQSVLRYVANAESAHPDVLGDDRDDDIVRDRWDALLEGCIGTRLEIDEAWVKKANRRYEARIPPGFEDQKKDEVARQYGDLILWFELIEHTKHLGDGGGTVPVLFVTDDAKEDWWRVSEGQRLGPRPELVEEIAAVGGAPFWTYSTARFVQVGSERLGWEVTPELAGEGEASDSSLSALGGEETSAEQGSDGVASAPVDETPTPLEEIPEPAEGSPAPEGAAPAYEDVLERVGEAPSPAEDVSPSAEGAPASDEPEESTTA